MKNVKPACRQAGIKSNKDEALQLFVAVNYSKLRDWI